MDNAADGHVCNQKELFFEYFDDPTTITGATSSSVSPGKGTIHLKLTFEDETPGSTLTLTDVWYMPQCPANLISQAKLNDVDVFYDNKDWSIYLKATRQILGYVSRINNSFVFKTLDNLDIAVQLIQGDNKVFQWPENAIYYASSPLSLSKWHARLGHPNIINLRQHLKRLDISYSDDIDDGFFYHSCEMAKATKKYNWTPQKRPTALFQKVHTDMVGKIKPKGMLDEIYFFTFTDVIGDYSTQQPFNQWSKTVVFVAI